MFKSSSIYKFMGGLVFDSIGDEENFDPHEHRVIAHPTSYLDTMTHMLKGSIGAGVLAMPYAVARVGIIYATITFLTLGIFATYCIQLLIKVQYLLCKRHRRGYMSYQKSMQFSVKEGPSCLRWSSWCLYWFVEITLIIWQLGICTIYFLFVAENIQQVASFHGVTLKLRMLLLYELLPMILLNLIKNLKMLSPFSTMSNLALTLGLLLVAFYMMEDDITIEREKLQMKGWLELPSFIGTALFALEAVGVILALEYNMKEPKRFVGICGLFNIGMIIIISLYLFVGIFGYVKYGDKIKPSITLNLPIEQKKAQAAKLLFAFAIFLSFPLQNFVAYSICWRRISKRYESQAAGTKFLDYVMRVVLVIVPWALAVAIPQLGPFISLFGAFCLSLLAFVFPAIMSISLCYPNEFGPGSCKLVRDILIFISGIVIMVSGVYASVLEIVEEFQQ